MKKIKYREFFLTLSLLIFFLLSLLKPSFSFECNTTHPILKNNACHLIYCSNSEFENSICQINNTIIKEQWLNNIIEFGPKDFRYLSFAFTSLNDIIIETTKFPESPIRIFFGLKKNGRFYFINNNTEVPFSSLNISEPGLEIQQRYESENTFIKLSNTEQNEFLLSFGNSNYNVEIFDINLTFVSRMNLRPFLNITGICNSDLFSLFKLKSDQSKNYYILAINENSDGVYKFVIRKYYFTSTDFENGGYHIKNMQSKLCSDRKTVSCFETEKSKIICFYNDNNKNYIMIAYNNDLSTEEKSEILDSETNSTLSKGIYIFYKCIHFKKEIGAFIYFLSANDYYPIFTFKEYLSENNQNQFQDYNSCGKIYIDKYKLFYKHMLNDIIKINDNKVCYVSPSNDKEILYIIFLNFSQDDTKITTKYFMINMFSLYNHKFLLDIKISLYNNFIFMGFSHCNQQKCEDEADEHYTSLILFSYANSTDFDFNVINQLYNTNENITEFGIDFTNYLNIENNIFQYKFKGIQIINFNKSLNMLDLDGNFIQQGNIITNNKKTIKILFQSNENYLKSDYIIEYALVLQEPGYNESNSMYDDDYPVIKNDYIGRTSYCKIIIEKDLKTKCKNTCSLCLKENDSCITCKNKFIYYNNEKVCYEKCTNVQILDNKCNENITSQEIEDILTLLEREIESGNYTGENKIIKTNNVVFQVSLLNDQKNNSNNISSIDFTECEKILKQKYNNDKFIMIKIDIKSDNLSSIYVQYEIYDSNTLKKVNLDNCKDAKIIINIPVNLTKEIEGLYNSLNESGYNLFNPNSSFYNDICTPYDYNNVTDIILSERQNIYINNNLDICQENCSTHLYNLSIKQAKCLCLTQQKEIITNISEISFFKEVIANFYTTIINSNFLTLKCYRLVFNISKFIHNIGSIILFILFIIFIILMIIYLGKEYEKLEKYKNMIIEQKHLLSASGRLKKSKNKSFHSKSKKNKKINDNKENNKKKLSKLNNIKKYISRNEEKIKNKNEYKNPLEQHLKKLTKNKNPPIKKFKENSLNDISNNFQFLSDGSFHRKNFANKNKKISKNIKLSSIKNEQNSSVKIIKLKNIIIKNDKNSKPIIGLLNEEELNTLEYQKALKIDKRTYFQYYKCLLKRKHLILFTFFPANDYNLITIKYALFIISFSLYFTINGFFFTDDSMIKIQNNNGKFNLLFQIPYILYSSIISGLIKTILNTLSLSERDFLRLKNVKENLIEEAEKTKKHIQIKIVLFFILGSLFIMFFWYFISCFCAVYVNTQRILIEDTLSSFGLSLLYPFALKLVPGIFRIPALKDPKKDKECLYKLGNLVSLIL